MKQSLSLAVTLLGCLSSTATAFTLLPIRQTAAAVVAGTKSSSRLQLSTDNKKDDEEENPYQDPNYPDLEFVNYDDPEYQVDQGSGDEFYDASQTEAEIEAMREERRLRNDEFQFQTYFQRTLGDGVDHLCDWTIYQTSTFTEKGTNVGGIPKLIPVRKDPFQVTARATKQSADALVNEIILHEEIVQADLKLDQAKDGEEKKEFCVDSYYKPYWPAELKPFDFRGQQGNMVCGNAWTICTAKGNDDDGIKGPFSEYRAEVGIQYESMRFRVKLDYSTLKSDDSSSSTAATPPPLFLKYLTVCREVVANPDGSSVWPRANEQVAEALFGAAGAEGGLFDPPPVGEEQIEQYMKLDLPGRATILLPYKMDQDNEDQGWVTSLDWTPGLMRFQADRKVSGGSGLLGLRSLELTEIQSADAANYRPKDDGEDMRQ